MHGSGPLSPRIGLGLGLAIGMGLGLGLGIAALGDSEPQPLCRVYMLYCRCRNYYPMLSGTGLYESELGSA